MKETVLSGMRSTGKLHLGNYFGAALNFVKMQHEYNCYFFIADYHSPDVCTLYVQSDVPEIPELYLLLNMIAYKGELEKTASFKDKVRTPGQTINAGLLTYPVLMAADILIHRAHKVPVGKDQEQHLEMTRNYANRFNRLYEKEVFPEPVAFNFGVDLVKVPGLDGSGKMGKSEGEGNAIFIIDDEKVNTKKIMRAKTDIGPTEPNSEKPVEIENLFNIMRLISAEETITTFDKAYNDCSIRYGDLKKQLATDVENFVAPIRDKAKSIYTDELYLKKIMQQGAEKARTNAQVTMKMVREAIGIDY